MPIYLFKSKNKDSKFYEDPLEILMSVEQYERAKRNEYILDEFGDSMKPMPTTSKFNLKGEGFYKQGDMQ